jgi:hypothetical protein
MPVSAMLVLWCGVSAAILGHAASGGVRQRQRINLHRLGDAFLGDLAPRSTRRQLLRALFSGFISATRTCDQLALSQSLF